MEPLSRVLRIILTLLAIMVCVSIVLLVLVHTNETVRAPGLVRPAREIDVRSPMPGIVDRVCVREGDRVDSGAPVVFLDQTELSATVIQKKEAIEQTRIEIDRLQAGLERFRAGQRGGLLEKARIALRQAESKRTQASELLERERALARDNLSTAERLAEREFAHSAADAEYEAARTELSLVQLDLVDRERDLAADLGCKLSELDQLKVDLAEAKRFLEAARITASMSGWVETPEVDRLAGQQVAAGQTLVTLANLQEYEFRALVSHADRPKVSIGQAARLRLDAFPPMRNGICPGQVTAISAQPIDSGDGSYFVVHVRLGPPAGGTRAEHPITLRPGLRGVAEIVVRPRVSLLSLLVGRDLQWKQQSE
jgi:multidrug resistance efflux pump